MIYDENHNGIQLTSNQVGTRITADFLQGFFTKSDLQELLNQTDCVGIRVYNAVGSSTDLSRRILGVGVRTNGSEKDARSGVGYILSQAFTGAVPANGDNIGRDEARDLVELADSSLDTNDPREIVNFSSYFSKSMLNGLLADKNSVAVAGLGFYVDPTNGLVGTHIGAAFGGTPLQLFNATTAGAYIRSDKPCPGTCAVLAPGEMEATATSATVEATNTNSSILYLVKWMK